MCVFKFAGLDLNSSDSQSGGGTASSKYIIQEYVARVNMSYGWPIISVRIASIDASKSSYYSVPTPVFVFVMHI